MSSLKRNRATKEITRITKRRMKRSPRLKTVFLANLTVSPRRPR